MWCHDCSAHAASRPALPRTVLHVAGIDRVVDDLELHAVRAPTHARRCVVVCAPTPLLGCPVSLPSSSMLTLWRPACVPGMQMPPHLVELVVADLRRHKVHALLRPPAVLANSERGSWRRRLLVLCGASSAAPPAHSLGDSCSQRSVLVLPQASVVCCRKHFGTICGTLSRFLRNWTRAGGLKVILSLGADTESLQIKVLERSCHTMLIAH
jgi:hypothetical protein